MQAATIFKHGAHGPQDIRLFGERRLMKRQAGYGLGYLLTASSSRKPLIRVVTAPSLSSFRRTISSASGSGSMPISVAVGSDVAILTRNEPVPHPTSRMVSVGLGSTAFSNSLRQAFSRVNKPTPTSYMVWGLGKEILPPVCIFLILELSMYRKPRLSTLGWWIGRSPSWLPSTGVSIRLSYAPIALSNRGEKREIRSVRGS